MLSEEEFAELSGRLREDPAALDYYLEFMSLCAGLLNPGEITVSKGCRSETEDLNLSTLLLALAEDEHKAEIIPIEKPEPEPLLMPAGVETGAAGSTWSSTSFYAAAVSTVAWLFLIAYIVNLPRTSREPVATLTGSSQAVWESVQGDPVGTENGRLYTDSALRLVGGFAEITFDNQAKIILQSPAELHIEGYNQVFLRGGKLSALIPKTAWGFIVRTAGASIIDYGTEFGITADAFGRTEAHVFKGKIELRSGSDPARFDEAVKLSQGQAGCIHPTGALTIATMKANPSAYVRRLPQKATFGQPGKRLDLADLIGGGNGFGTGSPCVGINPATGRLTDKLLFSDRQQEHRQYCRVPEMVGIDGVFVPLGGEIPPVVTSQGHLFAECPLTDGCYWNEISNRPLTSIEGNSGGVPSSNQLAHLEGIQYGTAMHPAIMLHANAGITFDLDAIRSLMPGVQIRRFTSVCGLSDTLLGTMHWGSAAADIWVLVDGQKRQAFHLSTAGQRSARLHIEIDDNNRFLTLIATDGENGNSGDWTFFGDPALVLDRVNQL